MKIKLSRSQWKEMGKKAGWSPLDKNKILDDAFDFLNSAEKQLSVAGETDLAIELQKFSMKVLDRKQKKTKTIGKKLGKIKESQSEDFVELMDSLDEDNPAKLKPAIRMIIKDKEPSSFGILVPERDFDKRKLDQILGKHEFNAQPQTIKELARKLWHGVSDWKSDEISGYSLFVDGKAIDFSS